MKKVILLLCLFLLSFLCFADDSNNGLSKPSESWVGKKLLIKFGSGWGKDLKNKEVTVTIKIIEKDDDGYLMFITEKPYTEKGHNYIYFKWFNKNNKPHLEAWEEIKSTNIDNTDDLSDSDFWIGLVIFLSIFIFGWSILIFKIIRSIKLSKFKKQFNAEKILLIIVKNGFWGISVSRVIHSDKKNQIIYNYTFSDIYNNVVDKNFSNELSKIKNHKNYKKFNSYLEKYLKCEEYPDYRDNILNKTIILNMPMDLVIFIFGQPGDRKEQVTKNKIKENLFFGGYINRQGRMSFTLRVDFEDKVVIGWKDL